MSTPRQSSKCSLACHYCRLKKAKCSGARPCGNCVDHNEVCTYPAAQRRTRKRKERDRDVEDRLSRMELLLRAATQTSMVENRPIGTSSFAPQEPWSPTPTQGSAPSVGRTAADMVTGPIGSQPQHQQPVELGDLIPSSNQDVPLVFARPNPCHATTEPSPITSETISRSIQGTPAASNAFSQATLNLPETPPSTMAAGEVAVGSSHENDSSEQHGSAYLSICSFPAVEWVSHQIGLPDFITSARRLSADVMRGEQLKRNLEPTRAPEPDMETAFKWSNAYFNNCLDSIFGVVDRLRFETRLRADFETDSDSSSDKAWYALRNTVYASGCRIVLSEDSTPTAFSESRSRSWKYYENALSVHTDLLYFRTDLASVQALLLMAFYAEALGSPCLEYLLLSNATRIAQSKGLHLHTPEAWKISHDDTLSRQLLWWTIYAYDKHLSFRSGRPSAIDDDYISCPMPSTSGNRRADNLEFVTKTVKHAQISSAIAKQLTSAKAMRDTPEQTLANVRDLESRLKEWRESLDLVFRTRPPLKNTVLPPGMQKFHMLLLHFSYYSSLIAIHGVFCYPWNRTDVQNSKNPDIHAQIKRSTEAVAEASRQIILAVQRLEITAALPVWLTFFFPLVGLINLFIYVLKNPHDPSVTSDLSLMDIVVGHFGYLEFISSSELEFPFPREITSYARNLVRKAREGPAAQLPSMPDGRASDTHPNWPQMSSLTEATYMDNAFLGLEDWRTILPTFSQVGSLMFNGSFNANDIDFTQANL